MHGKAPRDGGCRDAVLVQEAVLHRGFQGSTQDSSGGKHRSVVAAWRRGMRIVQLYCGYEVCMCMNCSHWQVDVPARTARELT